MLPDVDERLTGHAHQLAAHARPLLRASHGCLLSLTVATQEAAPAVAMCWIGMASPPVPLRMALVSMDPVLHRALARFEQVGERLVAGLSHRWPANAVPPAMGIVTDGEGVMFSSEYPSPLRPDWLALHRAGLCAPAMLLPASPTGAWARLIGGVADHRVH